ncbi:alpha-glucosidase family protein [Wenzhouxiangella sp. AB-CW3]|uniref:alpha-glucosidase family protein n=1 Tax=Wenzhouxiangella sp. AB-CW3 TaxID=2771012 RepID=UPI001CC2D632|nr:alpha-glucosidase family protein [Wenzhouxiangella sp. AB-CW3]
MNDEPDRTTLVRNESMQEQAMGNSDDQWWRGGLFYQVYPRSFQDSNDDGIGDLPGLISRLDYIADLGVDAIWISPFFKSPMMDFGYDVADSRDVDPIFGTLQDFDELLEQAHQRGLKVIIDQIPSHTSSEHPWFIESRQSRTNPRADWYVWADPREDGTPPNNWLSIFGGGAWQWDPRRRQYYLHNFLASQPDLNFHNPEVVDAVLDNLRFWLDRGVDGFRLDAINFCYQDRKLRDNPAKPAHLRTGRGFSPDNPYAYQFHYYNNTQPENITFIERIRQLLDQYPGATTLGEISSEDSVATMAEYAAPGRLHMSYSFELLTDDFSASHIRATVERLEADIGDGWACWAISNHDVERVISRWGRHGQSKDFALMLTAMLCSLRGSACIYQGEELGLPEAELPYEALQDPYGLAFWPDFKGRDGCRTPIPWNASPLAGFSTAEPWLPIPDSHRRLAVEDQSSTPDSILNRFRKLIAWRQRQPALRGGSIRFLDTPEPVLMFLRECREQRLLLAFNLSDQPALIRQPGTPEQLIQLNWPGLARGRLTGDGRMELPGHSAVILDAALL